MPAAALPRDEIERIAALERYGILDSLPEIEYDDLTLLASQICDAPVSLVSLVASERQWFKSHHGVDVRESPRALSFCAHAIHGHEVLEVPDATLDARFCDNDLVTGEHHVRFYAGAPLVTPDGLALGTLCVIDRKPRRMTETQRAALSALARQVVSLLELRRSVALLEANNRELRESREEFRSFMDNTPIVAFSKDRAGRLTYGNKTWESVFGFPIERARGRTDFDWLPFDIATAIRENDLLVMNENRVVQTIEQVPTPTNPRCEWLVFKFPIGEGDDMKLGGVALDLTELRRAEKLKDEFIAVVSHELRTPLTALRGSLGLLDNQVAGMLPPHASEMVKLALKNAERLALLINDLLDMEKIESGNMRFVMGEIELERLLQSAIELNKSYARPLGVRLQLEPLPATLRGVLVRGDEGRLMQVLSNLLSNAAKFTAPTGGVLVRARLVAPQNDEPQTQTLASANDKAMHDDNESANAANGVAQHGAPHGDRAQISVDDAEVAKSKITDANTGDPNATGARTGAVNASAVNASAVNAYASRNSAGVPRAGEVRVRIEVCDEGKGVPAEFVGRLFERFAQADTSATRRRGGTGLGLAISRAIIEKHGTRIGYQAPDENCAGATFFFELQIAQPSDESGQNSAR